MATLIANDGDLDMLIEGPLVSAAVNAVLVHEGVIRDVNVSVSFVDEDEMRGLNAAWRGIDAPTDVLSFECDSPFDDDVPDDEPIELGDVILCPGVIASQAPEFGNTPAEECLLMPSTACSTCSGTTISTSRARMRWRPASSPSLRTLAVNRGLDPHSVRIGPMTRHLDD